MREYINMISEDIAGTTTIGQIVDDAMFRLSKEMATGKVDFRSVLYMAVQQGMADAYERGQAAGRSRR